MPHDAEIQTRSEPAPVPARPCAAGCGAWADFRVGGVALCRDCAEALAEAYGLLPPGRPLAQTKHTIR